MEPRLDAAMNTNPGAVTRPPSHLTMENIMELQLHAGPRRPLPPRRHSETRRLVWAGQTIHVTVGYDGNLEPKEVFYSGGYRSGSDMEALVSDLCIALSVMLQHEGVTAASLGKSMGETFDVRTREPMPASILGLLLEELVRPPG